MKQRGAVLSHCIPRYVLYAQLFYVVSALILQQIIFAIVFEFTMFHTTPSPLSIIGIVMILSSAIYTTVISPLSPLTFNL